MKVFKTPNTGATHNQSVWDLRKTNCGKEILGTWIEMDGDITCDKCLNKTFKRRKFTPSRKFV